MQRSITDFELNIESTTMARALTVLNLDIGETGREEACKFRRGCGRSPPPAVLCVVVRITVILGTEELVGAIQPGGPRCAWTAKGTIPRRYGCLYGAGRCRECHWQQSSPNKSTNNEFVAFDLDQSNELILGAAPCHQPPAGSSKAVLPCGDMSGTGGW